METPTGDVTRREFNSSLALGSAVLLGGGSQIIEAAVAPAASQQSRRPQLQWGVSSGDVTAQSAIIWSRTDRPARMWVDVSATDSFSHVERHRGPDVLEHRDYTGKLRLVDLPAGEELFYRVRFESLEHPGVFSEPQVGRLKTAPADIRNVSFIWSGDTAGQGYGIDVARGGMQTYRTMRELRPDFFVHCGDTIYADNPFPESITLPDGSEWRNLVTPETTKVAETLDEFRGNFRYNLLDDHVRAFQADVPQYVIWDDHETRNNWYPGEQLLDDDRYRVKSTNLLAARAKTAFFEYLPIDDSLAAPQQVSRTISYGPLLQLFFLDMRSFRGPNSPNSQETRSAESAMLGEEQIAWLKRELARSTATWKVICSDMPLGLVIPDDGGAFEGVANGSGPPRGRELEIADLLRFIRDRSIRNTVWLTADVHYAASHYYDPNRAVFQDFDPFWEFVSGPLHAGTFGPNALDNTFGPQVRFQSIPADMQPNQSPAAGLQFFGHVAIDGETRSLTVTHFDVAGTALWSETLMPAT